jgi:PLU-1-like protein/PHD-finger
MTLDVMVVRHPLLPRCSVGTIGTTVGAETGYETTAARRRPVENAVPSWIPGESLSTGTAEREWTERLRSWHAQYRRRGDEDAAASAGPRQTERRDKKRPRSAISPAAEPWLLPLQRTGPWAAVPAQKRPVDGALGAPVGSEEYLAGGRDPSAWLIAWAQWTRSSARRAIRRRREDAPHETSNAWSARLAQESCVSCAGDYRDVLGTDSLAAPRPWEDAELQEIWTAVRCCAELMVQQIQSRPPRSGSIYLSEVWHFLYQVSQLPACREDTLTITEQEILVKVLTELVDAYAAIRWSYARLLDLWGEVGVDPDVILKEIDSAATSHGIVMDCLCEMKRHVHMVASWQKNVDKVCAGCNTTDNHQNKNDLVVLEELLKEGRGHGIQVKGLIALEQKVERANQLQERILLWKESSARVECREPIKFTATLVREIHRLKIRYPVANELLLFQQEAESWVERANIAIRSRISLEEIKTLMHHGLEMPIDLSEYLEKLQARVAAATIWLESFIEVIRYPVSVDDSIDYQELILRIRAELDDSCGRHHILHDLAMEGSRIPVEMDVVKVLHVELEARAWVLKTKRWLPDLEGKDDVNRRGKLDDLREHVAKAKVLRGRMNLTSLGMQEWILEGETELLGIVNAADEWMQDYQPILDGSAAAAVSIEQLEKIVERGNAIYVNLGNEAIKLSRFLVQAKSWYKEHYSLFVRCYLREGPILDLCSSATHLQELKDATAVAESDFPVLLSEAFELQTVIDTVEDWMSRVSLLRMTRRSKKSTQLFTLEDIQLLMDEGRALPVNTEAEVTLLRDKSEAIQKWHVLSIEKLEHICSELRLFREGITMTFGPPKDYKPVDCDRSKEIDGTAPVDFIKVSKFLEAMDSDDFLDESSMEPGTGSGVVSQNIEDLRALGRGGHSDCDIYALIQSFASSSNISPCIVTPETEVANLLKTVMRWCLQSLTYIENQHIIFDKRCFMSFDRFLLEGKELLEDGKDSDMECDFGCDSDLANRLSVEWMMLVNDQLERLTALVSSREKYLSWSKKVEQHLNSEERRPTLDKVNELAGISKEFPASCELVRKVNVLADRCNNWVRSVRIAIAGPEKISFSNAKIFFDESDKLGFTCDEIKTLRNGLKAARSWVNRMKRSKSREGEWDHDDAQALVDEHDTLMIDVTEEAKILRGALKRYCLCRRTMDGFMIACDECNDWFHGSCVGISKKRAVDRVAKYTCLRCSITKTYKSSSLLCVNVIRKWLSPKEMKKIRQAESQKQKRRIRKEIKDMECAQAEIILLRQLLDSCSFTCMDGSVIPQCENTSSNRSFRHDGNSPSYDLVSNDATAQDIAREPLQTVSFSVVSESENDVGVSTGTCASVDDDAEGSPNDAGIFEIPQSRTTESEGVLNNEGVIEEDPGQTGTIVKCSATMELSREPAQSTECSNKVEIAAIEPTEGMVLSKDELLSKIGKLETALEGSRLRLREYEELAKLQAAMDKEEMKRATQLRSWVIRVRSLVLVPSTAQVAMSSKPHRGAISDCMVSVANYAARLDIQEASDVKIVLNSFRCMSWCLHALSVFTRQPKANEIDLLVREASSIDFPDEKAVRTIKALAHRIAVLESKVQRALAPAPGETEPFNLESLRSLVSVADDLPVCIPIEQRLTSVIEDKGSRHCLCGGPSDGRFMLSCDKCDRWFHGHCVAVDPNTSESHENEWKCPVCCGQSIESIDLDLMHFHEKYDFVDDESVDCPDEEDPDEASKAPDPAKLWPPFGLFGSPEATLALGEEVCAVPDCVDVDLDDSAPCSSALEKVISSLSSSGCKLTSLSETEVKSNVSSIALPFSPPVNIFPSLTFAVDNGDLRRTTGTNAEPQAPRMVVSHATVPVDMEVESKAGTDASLNISSKGVESMVCGDDTPQLAAVVSNALVPETGFESA